jgi:hypothetical protein
MILTLVHSLTVYHLTLLKRLESIYQVIIKILFNFYFNSKNLLYINIEFVARPFIHSFEYALDSLLNLKSKVHQRIGELEVASQQAELAQKQNVKNLEYGFQVDKF